MQLIVVTLPSECIDTLFTSIHNFISVSLLEYHILLNRPRHIYTTLYTIRNLFFRGRKYQPIELLAIPATSGMGSVDLEIIDIMKTFPHEDFDSHKIAHDISLMLVKLVALLLEIIT